MPGKTTDARPRAEKNLHGNDDALRHDDGRPVEVPANRAGGPNLPSAVEANAGSRGAASGRNLEQEAAASGTPAGGVRNAGDAGRG